MSLSEELQPWFGPNARTLGEMLFLRGRLRIDATFPNRIEATIAGSLPYRVTLARTRDGIGASCTCPAMADSKRGCRHVWAVVLAAENAGHLENWTGSKGTVGNGDGQGTTGPSEGWLFPQTGTPVFFSLGGATKPTSSSRRPDPSLPRPLFSDIEHAMTEIAFRRAQSVGKPVKALFYIVDFSDTPSTGLFSVRLATRTRRKDGAWGALLNYSPTRERASRLADRDDRRIVAMMLGASKEHDYFEYDRAGSAFRFTWDLLEALLPMMCATGRCLLRATGVEADPEILRWDGGAPYVFHLTVRDEKDGGCRIGGSLCRDGQIIDIREPVFAVKGGLVFFHDNVAQLDDSGAWIWIPTLREGGPIRVRPRDRGRIVEELLRLPGVPPLDLPEDLRFEETVGTPRRRLMISRPDGGYGTSRSLRAALSFDYEGTVIEKASRRPGVYLPDARRLIRRNEVAEEEAERALGGMRALKALPHDDDPPHFSLSPRDLPRTVRDLTAAGWIVEAEGKLYRSASGFSVSVSSGIDWFDLKGEVHFDDVFVPLPRLLRSLRRGESTVLLDDGTLGIVPEEWLERYALLGQLGDVQGETLRFTRAQSGFLDVLLASAPEVKWDDTAARARDELRRFTAVLPADPTPGFAGELRPYQKDGLGWLHFLRRFAFGGCLADDMGLGKTVQVLALLEFRRVDPERGGEIPRLPSLVIVPRSLIFNWRLEAARFAPDLRLIEHWGPGRTTDARGFDGYDIVITTYGTLRRDVGLLKDVSFDYAVLDESQAIKNADSDTAKAARLLTARHRLALSGTPMENHLGELGSLIEFLNPGMLGSSPLAGMRGPAARDPDEPTRRLLARALRPFILRRTKDQVATDLPRKTEQIMYCELDDAQRALYDELRDHYRTELLGKAVDVGLGRMKIIILEALLRLRQAALHPGLIDEKRRGEPSAKLDAFLPSIAEVIEEGHKALVFSQFTRFLAIVRERLDRMGVRYEYLDGRTRDRQARVDAFQSDPDLPLFLVSLKAGGLGLNLTAADYVFLLDPWWNPAVESQAIDRAHRIGQTRNVFAYRLIARGTVEERILELQKTKRDLVSAIISADNSLIRNLTREDLSLLLS